VQVVGLTSYPEYNDKYGTVKAYHADKDIYAVIFDHNNAKKGLAAEHLQVLNYGSTRSVSMSMVGKNLNKPFDQFINSN